MSYTPSTSPTSVFENNPLLANVTQQNLQEIETSAGISPSTSPNAAVSSSPLQINVRGRVQPVANAAATIFSSLELAVENIMPGIYLTKNFIAWNENNLRAHGFTHIIIIDKHIQELYYPSPVFKLAAQSPSSCDDDVLSSFDYFPATASSNSRRLSFGKEFEAIDLNFGEKSYLTTVLPNCYKAVRFINKALLSGGTLLVIDCNGGEQKCLTIIVAYLMYKHNINFKAAFERLKGFYKKADLDRFYISQLYEYEPILQVQRAQSRGQSCSRELHSAILKRKKTVEDEISMPSECNAEFFDNLNPLAHFNVSARESNAASASNKCNSSLDCNSMSGVSTCFSATSIFANSTAQQQQSSNTNLWNSWDDIAME